MPHSFESSPRRGMDRRAFLQRLSAGMAGFSAPSLIGRAASADTTGGATLYNGIQLRMPWPPRRPSLPLDPQTPPYLLDPPAVIPIDVGRQLFVDDFLIDENLLERTYHRPIYHDRNPILRPDMPWENHDDYAERTRTHVNPAAMPFSDGVFFDPGDRLFKMWYMGGYSRNVCYAVSHDGLTWDKPRLDVVPGTNITMSIGRDSSTVWLDLFERDARARYKMGLSVDGRLRLFTASDGIHWRDAGQTGPVGDRTTFFYNPFRRVWVYSIRDDVSDGIRGRRYWEANDFLRGVSWRNRQPVPWVGADRLDPQRPDIHVAPQLYNLDAVAYESLLLGLFAMFRGERNDREKPNDIVLGFSRDGFHWSRPDRRPFLPVSERFGDWNWANVQSAGGVCLVVGDQLHFYVSGRSGVSGTSDPGVCSTGVATLRRDGFASLGEPDPGSRVRRTWRSGAASSVTTRPVRFSGGYLFVNADARGGDVRVAVLDRGGRVIEPFSERNCNPVRTDATRVRVTWNGGQLSALAGEVVRFRFSVSRARLYAFWVSAGAEGRSRGYLAAGGPGASGASDI
jgi:hypothetical protein